LLLRIRDPRDRVAWQDFVRLYAPLIHAYGMRRGLQDASAADLVQQVLMRVSQAAAGFEYDPRRGSFRGWLLTITRHEWLKMIRHASREPAGSGESAVRQWLEQQPDESADEAFWNDAHQRNLFHWAAEKVKPEFRETTWRAFWMTAVEGQDIDAVAAELQMTRGAIYIARSRIVARLRLEIEAVEGESK